MWRITDYRLVKPRALWTLDLGCVLGFDEHEHEHGQLEKEFESL